MLCLGSRRSRSTCSSPAERLRRQSSSAAVDSRTASVAPWHSIGPISAPSTARAACEQSWKVIRAENVVAALVPSVASVGRCGGEDDPSVLFRRGRMLTIGPKLPVRGQMDNSIQCVIHAHKTPVKKHTVRGETRERINPYRSTTGRPRPRSPARCLEARRLISCSPPLAPPPPAASGGRGGDYNRRGAAQLK